MTEHNVTHASFTLERQYDARPSRVFQAFADPAIKARWFAGPEGWREIERSSDFRVGGREVNRGGPPNGPVHGFEALYHDIVENERMVYAYSMYEDETRISVSLATIEFKPADGGTRLVLTEQGAFLDGHEDPALPEHGTRELLNALEQELQREPAQSAANGAGA